ncbi:hypothetical protein LPJ75_006214, partial [Coemansia sp. RSA 2598]
MSHAGADSDLDRGSADNASNRKTTSENALSGNLVVVFVPEHVCLSDIDQCIQDRNSVFVNLHKQPLDIEAARRMHRRIVVLERDHFVFYVDGFPQPFPCCYQSRNLVMTDLRFLDPFPPMFFNYWPLVLRNGLWSTNQPPRLFFVDANDSSYIQSSSADAHTIVEYYSGSRSRSRSSSSNCDSDNSAAEALDFCRFATVARAKTTCAPHFFVVKADRSFIAVDTNDAACRYTFTADTKTRVIRDLSTKKETVQSLVASDRRLQTQMLKMQPQPGFRPKDSAGRVLEENATFRLRLIRCLCQTDSGTNSVILCSSPPPNLPASPPASGDGQEYLCAKALGQAREKTVIHGSVAEGAIFSTKAVDGIVYLTLGSDYVVVPKSQNDDLTTSASMPDKSQRIQFHYDRSGNLLLSRWRDRVFA